MEKKRAVITALVLVAAIAITLFLTKGYWWPFVYYHCEQPCLPPELEPDQIIGLRGGDYYFAKVFTSQTPPSEYPELWLVDKNLLKGYAHFYYKYQLTENVSVEGPNNSTIIKTYVFKYKNDKIAKDIYEKSGLEDIEPFGASFAKVKHKPDTYVFQSSRFIVYINGSENISKNFIDRLLLSYYGE